MDLISKYGLYTVEKGTLLTRKAADHNFYDTMFFGFNTTACFNSTTRTKLVQIWETTVAFNTLFMIKGKNRGGRALSAVVDIYNTLSSEDTLDYISLKRDCKERETLIRHLRENGLHAWTCSVHNMDDMELFLFESKAYNSSVIKFIREVDPNSFNEFESFDRQQLNGLPVLESG